MADASPAERLDRVVDALLADDAVVTDQALRPLVETASRLRIALAPVPVSQRFQARLATRVAHTRRSSWPDLPTWLLVTGVASSAALGVGVTAYAVWRGTRRVGSR